MASEHRILFKPYQDMCLHTAPAYYEEKIINILTKKAKILGYPKMAFYLVNFCGKKLYIGGIVAEEYIDHFYSMIKETFEEHNIKFEFVYSYDFVSFKQKKLSKIIKKDCSSQKKFDSRTKSTKPKSSDALRLPATMAMDFSRFLKTKPKPLNPDKDEYYIR
jgi:hypothetical protein